MLEDFCASVHPIYDPEPTKQLQETTLESRDHHNTVKQPFFGHEPSL